MSDSKLLIKAKEVELMETKEQIEMLWARVNFMFDKLTESGIIKPKTGHEETELNSEGR